MGDDGKGISFGSGSNGQNQEAINSNDGGEPGGEPKYITLAEAKALAKQEAEAAFRMAQSLSDKAESRIQKQVGERLAEIERSYKIINGQELPAEQREGLRQRVIADVIAGSPSNQQSGNQGAQNSGASGGGDPDHVEIEYTDRFTQDLWEEYNMQIDEEDPEAKQLDFTSPKAFRKSLRPALESKKARLTANGQPANGDPTGRLPALGTGGTKGNLIAGVTDRDELWKMAKNRRRIK